MVKYISAAGSLAVIYSVLTVCMNGHRPTAFHAVVGVPFSLPDLAKRPVRRSVGGTYDGMRDMGWRCWCSNLLFSNEEPPQRQQ